MSDDKGEYCVNVLVRLWIVRFWPEVDAHDQGGAKLPFLVRALSTDASAPATCGV